MRLYPNDMRPTPTTLPILLCVTLSALSCVSAPSPEPSPTPSPPADVSYELLSVESPAIKAARIPEKGIAEIHVVLPASYAASTEKRYPVVYALHGFGDGALSILGALRRPLTQAAADGTCPEVILVAIEGGNSLGGSFYLNSPATGNWEDLVTAETVALIDARYRTVAEAGARLIAGYSMGGFGAWNIAIGHPDVFAAAWAACPGAWDPNGMRDTLQGWAPIYRTAYGAALAPDLSAPAPYAVVPTFDGSAADGKVIAAWERGFGDAKRKVAEYAAKGARLKGIRFEYGKFDSFGWIPRGTVYVAKVMQEAGLPAEIQDYGVGHVVSDGMLREGFLPFVARMFAEYAGGK